MGDFGGEFGQLNWFEPREKELEVLGIVTG